MHLVTARALPHALSAAEQLSLADRALAWATDRGLPVLGTLLGAAVLNWLAHRIINRLVERLTADRDDAHDRVATTELPVIRRQARLITRSFTETTFASAERQAQRITTLGSVLRSVATVVIWSVAILMVLDTLGINIAPLLASAGVAGVALGFGAQSLVKDFLSGVFMIVEDQYGVGDVVDTGDVVGTVVEVSLRVTTIRDFNGVIWYIRNGEIVRVANRSQGWSTALVDIPVASNADLRHVTEVITQAVAGMHEDPAWKERLIEPVEVGGVESITGNVATMRLLAKCAPNESIAVAREVRERALGGLLAAGIKPPAPLPFATPPH